MKSIFCALLAVLCVTGCDSRTTVHIIEDEKEDEVRVEIPPTASEIKLFFFDGKFLFEGETSHPVSAFSGKFEHGDRKGKTLQEVVAEKYPSYSIKKIERIREKSQTGTLTVYYVVIEKLP